MKIPFSKQEVGAMVAAALDEGWDPLTDVTDLVVHKGATLKHLITLVLRDGSELRLTKEGVETAIVVAFNKGAAPVVVQSPRVEEITFHQSDTAMAKVTIVSEAVESRFGSSEG